jgi:hypothetical protein
MTNSNAIGELATLLVPILRTETQQRAFVNGVVNDPSFAKNFQFGISGQIFAQTLIETLQNTEEVSSQPAIILIADYIEKNVC